MKQKQKGTLSEPVQRAVLELTGLIVQQFPTASLEVAHGIDDPEDIFIIAEVDIDDPDDVLQVVLDRMLALQLDDGIPVYVVPVHTPRRIAETRRGLTDRGHALTAAT